MMMLKKLEPLELGGGRVAAMDAASWRLTLPAGLQKYADAQLDDYRFLPRARFPWAPPLHFSLRARRPTGDICGTYGFGLWNDPFAFSLGLGGAARRLPASPNCAWFFYGSPPHDLELTPGVPGWGWKAQVLRSPPLPGVLLLPAAAVALALARNSLLRSPVIRSGRAITACAETVIQTTDAGWHTYRMDWDRNGLTFSVDDAAVLETEITPRPPLGFVVWLDNQYAVFSPRKGFRFGILPTPAMAQLDVADLVVIGE